jgi:hypothetical protein
VASIVRGLCFAVGRISWAGDQPTERQIPIQDNTNTEQKQKTSMPRVVFEPMNTLAATVLSIKNPMRSKTPQRRGLIPRKGIACRLIPSRQPLGTRSKEAGG